MPEVLVLLGAASLTALATGVGAIPVAVLGVRAVEFRPALLGIASGVMAVAAVVGLTLPALDEGTVAEVLVGLALGAGFLLAARNWFERGSRTGRSGGPHSGLVFFVLLVHSLPEGLAIGTSFVADREGLALFVVLAIAIQNIPEGTSVAVPMALEGKSGVQQFWAAVASSLPQPVGAVIAYLLVEQVEVLLPISFAFAAGAMAALVLIELLPRAVRERPLGATGGLAAGAVLMLTLSLALEV